MPLVDYNRKVFQRGQENNFVVTLPRRLGNLNHIRIWHDNLGITALQCIYTVNPFLTDTSSIKGTPRVGPRLSLPPLFNSLSDGHLSKTDTKCPSQRCPS